jgi:hypothetical protein
MRASGSSQNLVLHSESDSGDKSASKYRLVVLVFDLNSAITLQRQRPEVTEKGPLSSVCANEVITALFAHIPLALHRRSKVAFRIQG